MPATRLLSRRNVAFALTLLAVCSCIQPSAAWGARRQGDRLGIRGGIWPQPAISGSLGHTYVYPANNNGILYDARYNEGRFLGPFVEIYALFHYRSAMWLDLAAGWSTRRNVEVFGTRQQDDSILFFGSGRIDYFPVFIGIRGIKELGRGQRPHNVYARGGLSLLFANESPSLVQDSISKYKYTPGTEAAFGFLVGAGAEFYLSETFGALADVQYRYAKFRYAPDARPNLSGFWLSLGITYRNR